MPGSSNQVYDPNECCGACGNPNTIGKFQIVNRFLNIDMIVNLCSMCAEKADLNGYNEIQVKAGYDSYMYSSTVFQRIQEVVVTKIEWNKGNENCRVTAYKSYLTMGENILAMASGNNIYDVMHEVSSMLTEAEGQKGG